MRGTDRLPNRGYWHGPDCSPVNYELLLSSYLIIIIRMFMVQEHGEDCTVDYSGLRPVVSYMTLRILTAAA